MEQDLVSKKPPRVVGSDDNDPKIKELIDRSDNLQHRSHELHLKIRSHHNLINELGDQVDKDAIRIEQDRSINHPAPIKQD